MPLMVTLTALVTHCYLLMFVYNLFQKRIEIPKGHTIYAKIVQIVLEFLRSVASTV